MVHGLWLTREQRNLHIWQDPVRKVDTVAAKELLLYIENDGDLYRQQGLPILKNLVLKIDRGMYDHEKAVKLYGYLIQNGAQKYCKEFCSTGDRWSDIFNKPTREAVAREFVKSFETEYKLGAYNNLHAKKYSGKGGAIKNPVGRGRRNPVSESDYRVVNGTSYHRETSNEVITALERARATGSRIRIFYGDVKTGRSWNEENDVVGTLGRSTGTIKVPLLIASSRSSGGGALLDHAIVAILTGVGYLYQHPNFSLGKWEMGEAPKEAEKHGYIFGVFNDGQNQANFKTYDSALRYLEFMTGRAMSKSGGKNTKRKTLKNPAGKGREYRGFFIRKSGDNYRIVDKNGTYLSGIAANFETAKKWIDWHVYEMANRKSRVLGNPARKSLMLLM